MNKFLAVSKKPLSKEENKAFWCTYKMHNSIKGDLILVYVKDSGISQLFEIIDDTGDNHHILCDIRNMKTVWLKHIVTYQYPLSIALMKELEELKDLNALRRNFQQTTCLILHYYLCNILIQYSVLNENGL